jgi:REP element-mobilizing transposase RayT
MTSPTAIQFDTYYHIFNRGINRENIFVEDRNYAHFLDLYLKYIDPVADTFAYCLMRNHFHLLVRIKSEEEIAATLGGVRPRLVSMRFSNFFNAYARSINETYGRTGSLFQHPFGRRALHATHPFEQVVVYIHHNPHKHGFVDDYRRWKYSSYLGLLSTAPTRLKRAETLDWFGGRQGFLQAHEKEADPKDIEEL